MIVWKWRCRHRAEDFGNTTTWSAIQALKKLAADENELLRPLERWRAEAEKAGHKTTRIAVAFETGRDGFWLARWLRARGIEANVIHAASVAVSREHRRAKTDRLRGVNGTLELTRLSPDRQLGIDPPHH